LKRATDVRQPNLFCFVLLLLLLLLLLLDECDKYSRERKGTQLLQDYKTCPFAKACVSIVPENKPNPCPKRESACP